jgi:hypothetical protein
MNKIEPLTSIVHCLLPLRLVFHDVPAMHQHEGVALTSSKVASGLSHLHITKYLDMYDMNYKQNNGIPIEHATN